MALGPKELGRKLGLVGAMGAFALLAGFAPPALASPPTWLKPVSLSTTGTAQTPVVAMDGNGDSDAVWTLATNPVLETSFREAGPGDSFANQDITSGTAASTAPDVAEDGSGDAEAVWLQNGSVMWSWRTNDMIGFGGPAPINGDTCTGSESQPKVAVDSNGNVIAVWVCDSSGTKVIQAAYAAGGTAGSFNDPGNPPIVTLSDGAHDATNPEIADDPNGDATIVWQEADGSATQQIWFDYVPAGQWTSPTFASNPQQVDPDDSGNEATPAVAMDGSGKATAIWTFGNVTDTVVEEADATPADLTPATPSFGSANALTSSGTATTPGVADDSSGDTAVIWSLGGDAQAAVRPSGSNSFGSTATFGGGTIDAGTQPQIAITSSGDPIAVWQSSDTIEASIDTGSGFPSPTQISGLGATATAPTLAVDGQGNAITGWVQNGIATVDGLDGTGPIITNGPHLPATGIASRGLTYYAQPYDVWPAISSESWSFTDGSPTQTGPNITQTFARGGNFTATLTVTASDGNTLTKTQNISVAATAPTSPSGALTQLASPDDCVTSNAVGCGTRIPYGLNGSYQPVVSPDGKNVYAVGLEGGVVEFSRNTSTGALTEIGCITSALSAPDCTNGALPLNNPSSIAISPDGADVYVVTQGNHSIVTLSRNAANGQLTEQNGGCYTSYSLLGCTTIAGLENPYAVVVSPDGKNVYATGYDNHDIVEFTRNTVTGLIHPIFGHDCISDGTEATCSVQTAKGMMNPVGIAVSPNGNNVYVTAGGTQGNGDISEFTRDASTGALTPLPGHACIGSAIAGCDAASAINGSEDMAINSSGTFAYVNSFGDDAIVQLSRDASTGALTQVGCVGTSSSPATCATSNAQGIDGPLGVALSPDGFNLYASGAGDNAVAVFSVDPTTGVLTQISAPDNCITSDPSGNSHGCAQTDATGLAGAPRRLAVSPDGKNVYVANQGSAGLAELSRTAVPPPTISNDGEASYDSGDTASAVSATTTLPAVNCVGNRSGTFAGQAIGAKLYGSETVGGKSVNPAESAAVREYCDGTTPVYEPSFVVNDATSGTVAFHRAGITVNPGDQLSFADTATSSGATLQITDHTTGHSASITGPGFSASDGPDVFVTSIDGDGHGAPMLTGSVSAGSSFPQLAGPVPSTPVVFKDVVFNGKPLTQFPGLYGLDWVNSSKKSLASVSSISGGDGFTVNYAAVPRLAVGRSADVMRVSGTVLVKLPGSKKFVRLTSLEYIPIGSTINAIHGSVQVTVALPNRKTQTGIFFGGEFILRQARNGRVTAVLTGGSFKGCPKPPTKKHSSGKKRKHSKHAPLARIASLSRKHPVRHLWSNAHGSFSSSGRDGAAAVRGTEWLTQDQCDGTYFRVTRDAITVTSFHLHHHKTIVRQGHSFLAPAPGYK